MAVKTEEKNGSPDVLVGAGTPPHAHFRLSCVALLLKRLPRKRRSPLLFPIGRYPKKHQQRREELWRLSERASKATTWSSADIRSAES